METLDGRYKRLSEGTPVEMIDSLLMSLDNYLNTELKRAAQAECWDLVLIGAHSACSIIGFGLFGGTALGAYKQFLKKFVDCAGAGNDYSSVAADLHGWRNVLAHRWFSKKGYEFGYDLVQAEGWRRIDGVLLLNPRAYFESFESAFDAGKPIWDWQRILNPNQQEEAKQRLLKEYLRD